MTAGMLETLQLPTISVPSGLSVQSLHIRSFSRLFKGWDAAEIRHHVNLFLTAEFTSMLYLPVIQRLQAAQARGDLVLILSSSPDF